MRDYDNVVCLAGTHGKTTSTSMMTLMTMEAQMDPTVMVGSNLPAIGGTLRIGGKGCFVLKAANTATRSCALHRPLRLSSM